MYFADIGFLLSLTEHLIQFFFSVVSANILPVLMLMGVFMGVIFIVYMFSRALHGEVGGDTYGWRDSDAEVGKGYGQSEWESLPISERKRLREKEWG